MRSRETVRFDARRGKIAIILICRNLFDSRGRAAKVEVNHRALCPRGKKGKGGGIGTHCFTTPILIN